MAEYQKQTQRFAFGGISASPADTLQGTAKFPFAKNIRAYRDGTVQPRAGLIAVVTPSLGSAIHSLMRLNDPTTFNGGVPAVRVYGAGGDIFRGIPSDTTPSLLDSGYSGDPLTWLSAQPSNSPRPYLFVADSDRYRKFSTDGDALEVGVAQPSAPSTEPLAVLGQTQLSSHDLFSSTAWTAAGAVATNATNFNRVDTTISLILFDIGTTGYCSIVPADFANFTVGMLVTVGPPAGSFDNALITDITIAVQDTTVGSIIYDAGNTGLCTIQPAGSLGTGQLDAPSVYTYQQRAFRDRLDLAEKGAKALPINPNLKNKLANQLAKAESNIILPTEPDPNVPTRRIRQIDFPVNCLVELNSAETVRILSVAVGSDGIQSFRCSTSTTISAGDTITGMASFRVYLPNAHVAGEQLTRPALENILTYVAPASDDQQAYMTGGIQGNFPQTLAQFSNGQAVLPEDELHLAINVDRLTEVVSVRVYIDVDATTNDFLQNYYFFEWRASDIITAIQSTNAANVTPLATARQTVVTNAQLERVVDVFTTVAEKNRQLAPAARRVLGRLPVAVTAVAQQLQIGNNQWVDLRVKLGALNRVGTDPTRSLANATAYEVLLACQGPLPGVTPEPITVKYSDLQIYGGSGPDVGEAGNPYVHTYRYRSSITGATSNPAPANRASVIPRRQSVFLTAVPSTDPQVDLIDWFRLGGTLSEYTYAGSGDNTTTPFEDNRMDSQIDGGETIRYDLFQPWPLQDLARTGTCNVAGTAISWVSGDTFDTRWAPGSIIVVNGFATTLYASPNSSTLLQVVDNVGSGSAVTFSLPGPTILSQPLGRVWGDFQGFYFACGDTINPGTLYWSNGNNIEAVNDANALLVTSPSEPLMGGGIYNTFAFVFSSDELYQILLQPGDSPVRVIQTPCGRGLWTPWAFAIGPEGIFFLAADGIFATAGGSPAKSLTAQDIRPIFPKDGLPGESVNGIPAPDMTQTDRLRLSYIAGMLYFDYLDLNGDPQTLILDTLTGAWQLDHSDLTGLTTRLEEPGDAVYDQIVGGADGLVYQYDLTVTQDAGTDIPWALSTPWPDAGQPRVVKQWGDIGVDVDPNGSINGIVFQAVTEDGATLLPTETKGAGQTGRQSYVLDIDSGQGVLSRNLGLQITGTLTAGDGGRPTLFWWEPSFLLKSDGIERRATDWENLGYTGAKFVQGVIIRANTYGEDKVITVQKDGAVNAISFTINHDGEQQIAYPLSAAGWTPFVTELIRLVGSDDVDWLLLDYRFVWEPAPELATQWETQFTSHDITGYKSAHDLVLGYEATQPITLELTVDDRTIVQTLPATGGVYRRVYQVLCPNKGKAMKYKWTTPEPARIYIKDTMIRLTAWGRSGPDGGYLPVNPFGGPSRNSGAEI